jgi:putative zinc finger/helix-turn-helix YgiT family protein
MSPSFDSPEIRMSRRPRSQPRRKGAAARTWRDRLKFSSLVELLDSRQLLSAVVSADERDPAPGSTALITASKGMKPYPWKCLTCRERSVSPVVLPTYTMDLEHDGRTYRVLLRDFHVLKCASCNSIILDDEADVRLSEALRAAVGLLSPSEIRAKRERLKLTQKQLANVLQISESTLSRWETGVQIQQRCMDKFLRCFFDVCEVRQYLSATGKPWAVELDSQVVLETSLYNYTYYQVESRKKPWPSARIEVPCPAPGPKSPHKGFAA